jgi:hypothetical protein
MTYIIQSKNFTQEFIDEEILQCLDTLYQQNQMIQDYWLSQLYDEDNQPIQQNWNENTLMQMYDDLNV